MEQILPKKAEIQVAKCEGKINVVCIEKIPGPRHPQLFPEDERFASFTLACSVQL
jgi:hypothetical protein